MEFYNEDLNKHGYTRDKSYKTWRIIFGRRYYYSPSQALVEFYAALNETIFLAKILSLGVNKGVRIWVQFCKHY